jgi:hypothetical protein
MSDRKDKNASETANSEEGRGAEAKSSLNGSGDNVDKIRELLFGEQMVGYEARFKELESKLIAEVEALRQSVEDSVAELRDQFEKRADQVEDASVARQQFADSLEKLAAKIRG